MRLAIPFIDTDHVIEQRIGCSIRDYFDREGEASFRDLEQSVIADWPPAPKACWPPAGARCSGRPTGASCATTST
jgi:shikimate kinase